MTARHSLPTADLDRARTPRLAVAAVVGIWLLAAGGCRWCSQLHNYDGVGFYQQGYHHVALQRFQQAVTADPTNPDGYYNLAATFHQMGKLQNSKSYLDQAEHLYNQCLEYDPNHEECYRGLAVLLTEEGRKEEAQRLLESWAVKNPNSAAPKIELARLAEEQGRNDVALQHLNEAVEVEPNSARALTALAHLREQSGNFTQALTDYQRSLWYNANQPQVAQHVSELRFAMAQTQAVGASSGARLVNANPAVAPR